MSSRSGYGRTPLATRFLVSYALVYAILIGLMSFVVVQTVEASLIRNLTESLETSAELAEESLPDVDGDFASWADGVFGASGYRTTLIAVDGVVWADSHADPAVMENHADRPEVIEARDGQVGTATRVSASTGFEQLYLALPPEEGLIVRLSVPTREIGEELASIRGSIIAVAIVIGLLGVVVVALLGRRMTRPITELTEQSRALAEGDLSVLPRRSPVSEIDSLGVAISALAHDLGSRVTEAEQASEYLETVLGALPQGTVLIDANERIAYANPSAYELLGSVPEELAALSPFTFQSVVREARDDRVVVNRVSDHGVPVRRLRGVATPFTGDGRILLVVVDVTDNERSAAVRRDFVANASHELKTPVSSIIAASDALRIAVERDDPSALRFADQIQSAANQLDGLVADLLDLSRLERERPELAPIRFDLLVADELERVRELAAERGLELQADLIKVSVDGSHRDLAIAVRNLLDNAIHYTDENGEVYATLAEADGRVSLEVRDTGVGIPTRDIERIFERFYRVDAARSRATGGTGLGLSIVKHVTESHGGQVEVTSELGVGTSFTLFLPVSSS